MTDERPAVLIVDDEPLNVKIIRGHLVPAGYRILEAASGEEALVRAREKPDLILLDIMMPGMDGFETCRRLKEDGGTREIPVVFLSALRDPKNKTRGLELGGVDYVSKPFDAPELLARVKSHCTIRRQEIQIRRYATHLEQMVQERTQQLIGAERLATLGTFSAAVAHEINNPINYIGGSAELLKLFWEGAGPILERHCREDPTGRLARTTVKVPGMLESILQGVERITGLVRSLTGYSRQNEPKIEKCLLSDVFHDALNLLTYRLKSGVSVRTDIPAGLQICADPNKLSQVFVNLLTNALDAMEGKAGAIAVSAFATDEQVRILFTDNGPGIPQELAEKIFDPFFSTKAKGKGTGLGLFIIRSIVEDHGGRIALVPVEEGAGFEIVLPRS